MSFIRTTSLGTGATTVAHAEAPACDATRATLCVGACVPGRSHSAISLAEKTAVCAARSAAIVL